MDYDAIVNDPRFLPSRGWDDDFRGLQEPEYQPAAAQNRAEFIEFLQLVKPTDHVLQIGLCRGGTHRLFDVVCGNVWSIDCDIRWIDKYQTAFGNGNFIHGMSGDVRTITLAVDHGPYDVLFIDGAHEYEAVRADWLNYSPIVRPRGIVAFHDSIQRPHHEVFKLLSELAESGIELHNIGAEVGIAWYRTMR